MSTKINDTNNTDECLVNTDDNIHRDSVEYWKQATNSKFGLGKNHPTAVNDVCYKYLDLLNIKDGDNVLDVGVGFGRFIDFYAQKKANIYGIDVDSNMIKSALSEYKNKVIELKVKKAEQTEYNENFFDKIVCWGVFDELEQNYALLEFSRILKIGGEIIFTGKNTHYSLEDSDAYTAEIKAREKNHCNSFTFLNKINFEKFGFEVSLKRLFLKRGDFADDKFIEDNNETPERFYEYIVVCKKIKQAVFNKNTIPLISNKYSKTWLEKITDINLDEQYKDGTNDSPMLFVSGVYRSGTAIITQMLGAHKDIYLTYDSVKYLRFCQDLPLNNMSDLKDLLLGISNRICKRWNIKFCMDTVFNDLKNCEINHANVYNTVIAHIKSNYKPNATMYGEKIAVMWSKIPDFLEMFPNGKVIHIFRDPRDVTASFKKITYEPGFSYLDATFNCLHAMVSLKHMQEYYGRDKIMLINLEDLLQEPVFNMKKVCEFLNLEYDDKMVDSKEFLDKSGKQWLNNSIFEPSATGILSNSKRWESNLSRPEINFIELVLNSKLVENGYELSGYVPSKQDWQEIYKFIEDKFLSKRFSYWLQTGFGKEGYPSDPKEKETDYIKS